MSAFVEVLTSNLLNAFLIAGISGERNQSHTS